MEQLAQCNEPVTDEVLWGFLSVNSPGT